MFVLQTRPTQVCKRRVAVGYRKINFKCPVCGLNILSAKQRVYEYVELTGVDGLSDDRALFETGDVLDGYLDEVYYYACHSCGLEIGCCESEAIAWLEKNNMLGEEE
jgi:predicted RNA-binding Zn-ribbon protein involved in translation (DUF1610 family)